MVSVTIWGRGEVRRVRRRVQARGGREVGRGRVRGGTGGGEGEGRAVRERCWWMGWEDESKWKDARRYSSGYSIGSRLEVTAAKSLCPIAVLKGHISYLVNL